MDTQPTVSKDLFVKRFADLCTRGGGSGLPKDELDQHILLKSVVLTIEPGRSFSEQEINEKLATWINILTHIKGLDHISLRRYLVDAAYLERSPDGATYRVAESGPAQPTFDPAIAGIDLQSVLQARRDEIERRKQEYLAKARK